MNLKTILGFVDEIPRIMGKANVHPCKVEIVKYIRQIIKEWQEYKELEKLGKVVKVPCVVGDKVYAIHTVKRKDVIKKEIWDYTVTSLHIEYDCDWNISFNHIEPNGRIFPAYGEFKEIGKTVFLTKSEAEAALRKMNEMEG